MSLAGVVHKLNVPDRFSHISHIDLKCAEIALKESDLRTSRLDWRVADCN